MQCQCHRPCEPLTMVCCLVDDGRGMSSVVESSVLCFLLSDGRFNKVLSLLFVPTGLAERLPVEGLGGRGGLDLADEP